MDVQIFSPQEQRLRDHGDFSGQMPVINGITLDSKPTGPLFSWTWFRVSEEFTFPMHLHQGFEIVTYMLHGSVEHGDSLGNVSLVGPGGVQVMQAASGASHRERLIGPHGDGFQIWFDPDLSQSFGK